jgi:hypothetical protein
MESRLWDDGDRLLAELGEALRETRGAATDLVLTGGKAAFIFRTMDEELELASMVYDSLLDAQALPRGRAPGLARTVVFESAQVSVEIEVGEDGIVGQVVPALPGTVTAEAADGSSSTTGTDDMGCFSLGLPASDPVRLHFVTAKETVVTEWTHLRPQR